MSDGVLWQFVTGRLFTAEVYAALLAIAFIMGLMIDL